MNNKKHSLIFNVHSYTYFIIALTVFAFITKLMIGTAFYNYVDLPTFNQPWMNSLGDGLFDVYSRDTTIDYPPVFLILLYPFSWLLKLPLVELDRHLTMLVVKIVPVLFDCLMIPLIWLIFKNRSHKAAIIVASLWSLNCSAIVNSTLWGQTDCIMAFMLVLSFYFIDSNRTMLGGIIFGLACITKFQALYFAPIVFIQLVSTKSIKKLLCSVGSGIAAAVIVFLPFMIGSGNIWLIPDLYFGGFDKYNYATLNAANIYALLGLNQVQTDYTFANGNMGAYLPFLNSINIGIFNTVILALCIVGMLALYITAKRRSIWVMSLLFMQCIFMLTTKMHERYQFIVVPICLIFAYLADDIRFFIAHIALTVTTGLNQFILLIAYNNTIEEFWYLCFDKMLFWIAFANMLAFGYTVYACIAYCYDLPKRKRHLPSAAN